MDSLSHILIGAAIGEVTLGKKIGRWGMAIGALAKTFPDFDLFYTGLDDPRLYVCHHRGHTHSLIWETIYGILLAYLFYLIFRKKVSFKSMLITWLFCLYGHSLLDWFTNYGTRLWLPFTNESFALNTIAIVDLVFTVPMLVLSVWSLFYSNKTTKRFHLNRLLLIYCISYLGIISLNKLYMNHVFKKSMDENGIQAKKFMTNPTILNNILWYANAVNDSMAYVAEYSHFDVAGNIRWTAYPRRMYLAKNHPDQEDMKLLDWFSRGYSICDQQGDTLHYYAIKFGKNNFQDTALNKSFVFHYEVYLDHGIWKFGFKEPPRDNINFKQAVSELWNRMMGYQSSKPD
ncbi:MAG: metal-dependent hydrolase [Chitinophagaceae bacterium]|nr:metal-dependent hydrolase [Chitinophagaceae bacterium]